MVSVPLDDPDATQKIGGEALGEIAAAAYDAPLPKGHAQAKENVSTGSDFDVLIKNGHIIDGSGNPWVSGDIAIRGDRIVAIGNLQNARATRVIDAKGLVISPGFIDMLGQSEDALLIDNRSLSKLSQGITTEITGEGGSIAPQNALTLAPLQPGLEQYHLKVDWSTLTEYFQRLEELAKMKDLVAQAMRQGAFGISTALIYPPGHYAKTEELIELAKTVSQYGGIYGSHMRSEGPSESAAVTEAL